MADADIDRAGQAKAQNIEQVWYKGGSEAAIQALRADYQQSAAAPNGKPILQAEVARLVGDFDSSNTLLISLASQWGLDQLNQRGQAQGELKYNGLMPPQDAKLDKGSPDREFDSLMAQTLKNNWIQYGNLTKGGADGEVIDPNSVALTRDALTQDINDQETMRRILGSPPAVPPPQSYLQMLESRLSGLI